MRRVSRLRRRARRRAAAAGHAEVNRVIRPSLEGPGASADSAGADSLAGERNGGEERAEDEIGGVYAPPSRTVALVGLMGAGKTTIGRRLARALGVPFRDADEEIERAAGLSVQDIFDRHGESEFRRGERRVIARLLEEAPHILATGGGAFMETETRALLRARAVTVWLRADLDTLLKRVARRDHRPLLKQEDPAVVMQRLMAQRYPVYAEADIVVDTANGPHGGAVRAVLEALKAWQAEGAQRA
ncbi:MAG: shikimate kinase [Alphaproteobacteria bacterium]|nr:shikimate kinase [Alphaproteobacteria bacterium]